MNQLGALMGKGGTKIAEIRAASLAKVPFFREVVVSSAHSISFHLCLFSCILSLAISYLGSCLSLSRAR
jgi:hypothetical protein